MIPPIKWRVSFEVKISILVMCIKGIIQLWMLILAYSATRASESNRDLRYDVFDLPYDVYFFSATSSTPSRRPPM